MISFIGVFLRCVPFAVLAVCGLQPPLHAGGSPDCTVGIDRYGAEAIRNFAERINETLDAKKVNVAIIARAGWLRAEMPKGINYTHLAFIVFEPVLASDGAAFHTYTVYNLYQGSKGNETHSFLKQDFTYDFVAGIAEPDVAVSVPTEALQRRILAVIRSPAYTALWQRNYNLLANPWVDRFDNCVTHALKVCVSAIYQTDDAVRIGDIIRHYFEPTRVHLGFVKSIGSSFVPALRREDCDPHRGLQTATYDSLKTFLSVNGLLKEAFTVQVNEAPLQ